MLHAVILLKSFNIHAHDRFGQNDLFVKLFGLVSKYQKFKNGTRFDVLESMKNGECSTSKL